MTDSERHALHGMLLQFAQSSIEFGNADMFGSSKNAHDETLKKLRDNWNMIELYVDTLIIAAKKKGAEGK